MKTLNLVLNRDSFNDFLNDEYFFRNELDGISLIIIQLPWANKILKYPVFKNEIIFSKVEGL